MDNTTLISYKRYEFLLTRVELAVPCLIIITIASIVGTFGNTLILAVLYKFRTLRSTEAIFIANLAISDMYVTLIADPMSVVAKLEGEEFFVQYPLLCKAIGCICTVTCICSLLTIGGMAVNRYVHICYYSVYRKLYTNKNVLLMCGSFWCVGLILVLINIVGPGDHNFDHKSLECIWDRMASHPFTIFLSVVMVWIPLCLISFSYIRIYLYVKESKRRVHAAQVDTLAVVQLKVPAGTRGRQTMLDRDNERSLRLAKTLFSIYVVFAACWLPYALLIALDYRDEFSHELHLIITMTAHLHPSLNFIVYYLTNQKFRGAFIDIFRPCCCRRARDISPSTTGNGKTDYSSDHVSRPTVTLPVTSVALK